VLLEKPNLAIGTATFLLRLEFLLRLDPSVPANVIKLNSVRDQHTPHEESSMTRRRILLAAKERDSVLSRSRFQTPDSFKKQRRFRDLRVQHVAISVVELVSVGTPPEFFPEEEVLNSRTGNCLLEGSGVEVGRELGVRMGACIYQDFDLVLFQQAKESLQRMVGVPYRE